MPVILRRMTHGRPLRMIAFHHSNHLNEGNTISGICLIKTHYARDLDIFGMFVRVFVALGFFGIFRPIYDFLNRVC